MTIFFVFFPHFLCAHTLPLSQNVYLKSRREKLSFTALALPRQASTQTPATLSISCCPAGLHLRVLINLQSKTATSWALPPPQLWDVMDITFCRFKLYKVTTQFKYILGNDDHKKLVGAVNRESNSGLCGHWCAPGEPRGLAEHRSVPKKLHSEQTPGRYWYIWSWDHILSSKDSVNLENFKEG